MLIGNSGRRLLLLVLVVSLVLVGCDSDDPVTPPGGGTNVIDLPFAGSEDQLMENFRTVYEDMDFDSFGTLLHADHVFYLQPSTREEFPDIGETFTVADEMRIAERMFGGIPVTDPGGNLVPAVSALNFLTFEQWTAWADTPVDDLIPNARFALYEVTMSIDRAGHSSLRPVGQIKFYAAGRDSLYEGTVQQFYELIGQVDLTSNKSVESATWGSVKALFR